MKTGVILHGQKRDAERIRTELSLRFPASAGFEYRVTRQPRETVTIAREWSADKELIVVCGGDGTLHEAVNGMMEFRNAFPGIPLPVLGLLPLGTGNDYARQYGWKRGDVPQLCDRIRAMHTRQADVGEISRPGHPPRFFINAADAGLGAHVVSLVERMKGRWPSPLVFPAAVLRGMLSYRSRDITCTDGGGIRTGRSLTTVISLGKSFGDGLIIAPDGNEQDGLFRIARIGRISVLQYLRYLPALRRGRKIRHPEVIYFKTAELQLSGDAGMEADGEDAGRLPAHIRVIPHAIRILV